MSCKSLLANEALKGKERGEIREEESGRLTTQIPSWPASGKTKRLPFAHAGYPA